MITGILIAIGGIWDHNGWFIAAGCACFLGGVIRDAVAIGKFIAEN